MRHPKRDLIMSISKVFFYNPTCEIAISNGTLSYMPNKTLTKFEQDLDLLSMYFASEEDVILTKQMPDSKFLRIISDAGIKLPKIIKLSDILLHPDSLLPNKMELHPWGWSPRIHHIFKPLKKYCSEQFLNQPNSYWKDNHKELYSRKTALSVLNDFLQNNNNGYLHHDKKAIICKSVAEIDALIKKWKQIIIKAPWSSSGRGLQVLRYSYLNESITQWIKGTLEAQGYVMVEPLLNKKFDFSLQYYCDGKGNLNFLGLAFFKTNSNGQYNGNILGGIPKEIKNFLSEQIIKELSEGMLKELKKSAISDNYCGYFGVDCMIIENENGESLIHPCVEINLRYNMGTLAIILNQYIHKNSHGSFKINFKPKESFDTFHDKMIKEYPFKMKDGKWFSGYLPMVSPFQNKNFGLYVLLTNKEETVL